MLSVSLHFLSQGMVLDKLPWTVKCCIVHMALLKMVKMSHAATRLCGNMFATPFAVCATLLLWRLLKTQNISTGLWSFISNNVLIFWALGCVCWYFLFNRFSWTFFVVMGLGLGPGVFVFSLEFCYIFIVLGFENFFYVLRFYLYICLLVFLIPIFFFPMYYEYLV